MLSELNQIIMSTFLVAYLSGSPMGDNISKNSRTHENAYSSDVNQDGIIDADEFSGYISAQSDSNGDGYVTDIEWAATTEKWYKFYGDIAYDSYVYLDEDSDGLLNIEEAKMLIQKTNLYARWDKNLDGKIDEKEFFRGTVSAFSGDRDYNIDF